MDKEIAKEVVKEIGKDVYTDGAKPVVKPAGELLGLVPRAIKAALSPLEKWILNREYNIEETKKLLEKKLESIDPNLIEEPEPHIAVPAIQYISYCMDNEELRDMYANLLANSMNKVVKKGVHPGFVEIIKQLSPDEAKILKYFNHTDTIPVIDLRRENEKKQGVVEVNNFSDIGEKVGCEDIIGIGKSFDNLIRLGLIERAGAYRSLVNKDSYTSIKEHPYIRARIEEIKHNPEPYNKPSFTESYLYITDFGKAFCNICLNTAKTIKIQISLDLKNNQGENNDQL